MITSRSCSPSHTTVIRRRWVICQVRAHPGDEVCRGAMQASQESGTLVHVVPATIVDATSSSHSSVRRCRRSKKWNHACPEEQAYRIEFPQLR
jgi:hypothetical protein